VKALSPRGNSAFAGELTSALRDAGSFDRYGLTCLIEVCCSLLSGLSKTRGIFLPRPSELPLFDTTETFVQALWGCLQQLRGFILRNLNRETNKEHLLPSDVVKTKEFSSHFLAVLKQHTSK
jgi:hypothetical protein